MSFRLVPGAETVVAMEDLTVWRSYILHSVNLNTRTSNLSEFKNMTICAESEEATFLLLKMPNYFDHVEVLLTLLSVRNKQTICFCKTWWKCEKATTEICFLVLMTGKVDSDCFANIKLSPEDINIGAKL